MKTKSNRQTTVRQPLPSKHTSDLLRMVRLVNFRSGEYVTILPSLGGRVHEIVLKTGKKRFSILESPQTTAEIIENKHWAGVKLIPFSGRIVNAEYEFEGKRYHLRANSKGNFAIHGFIADKQFRIRKSTASADHASVVMDYTHDGKTNGYPFRFLVRLAFTLRNSVFTCTTEIHNIDSKSIPVGDGWHPYFKTSGSVARLLLSLPAHAVVEVTPTFKVPTGNTIKALRGRTVLALSRNTMDSVFDFGESQRRVTTKLIDPKLGLELQLWQESGRRNYRYLVVYRPPIGSSVAIEPWTCAPNAFNNNMGLIVLKPGAKFKSSYGVTLRQHKPAR